MLKEFNFSWQESLRVHQIPKYRDNRKTCEQGQKNVIKNIIMPFMGPGIR